MDRNLGVLVDAGIVMTENVIRHAENYAQEHGGEYRSKISEITLSATRLVGRPIFFSMAIIILAFVPVFALTGLEGKLFHPLAFTKTFAMAGCYAGHLHCDSRMGTEANRQAIRRN